MRQGRNIEISGLSSVYFRLEQIGDLQTNPRIKQVLRQGAKTLIVQGKANLSARLGQYSIGRLSLSMVDRAERTRASVYAGFLRSRFKGARGLVYPAGNHAAFVDKGTVERYTKKGYRRGKMPANYFWRDAYNSRASQIASQMERGITEILQG